MDTNALIRKISIDRNCNERLAKFVAEDLRMIHPDLQPALLNLVNSNEISNDDFSGITLKQIMDKKGIDIYSAFIDLSLLLHNPELVNDYFNTEFKIK